MPSLVSRVRVPSKFRGVTQVGNRFRGTCRLQDGDRVMVKDRSFKTEKEAAAFYNAGVLEFVKAGARNGNARPQPRRMNIIKGKRQSKPFTGYTELVMMYPDPSVFGLASW
jgi:hypothetical protein